MVLEGERAGLLTPGKTILDATSGNTGIAYAMIGAARGYAVRLCMPEQRHARAQAHPARVRRRDGVHRSARGVRRRDPRGAPHLRGGPGAVLLPGPVQQPGQLRAHYDTTGPEMLAQTGGRMTHFVAGLGTSGTFMGVGRFFRDDEAARPADLGAARHPAARSRGAQAHGVGDRPGHLRSGAGRRGHARRHRGCLHAHAASRDGRGPARRHLERRGAVGRPADRRAAGHAASS